jgi:hypothetical protein
MNRLNTSTKISEKEEKERKNLDQELQKEEEMSEYKKGHCCCCFEGFLKHKCLFCTCIMMIWLFNINGLWKQTGRNLSTYANENQ